MKLLEPTWKYFLMIKHMYKNNVNSLGFFGGAPLFKTWRPFSQLGSPDEKIFFKYCEEILLNYSNQNNLLIEKLEFRLSELHQVDFCVTCSNACLGLVMLMDIFAKGHHGEVIMPAFTYAGLPHLAQWAGQKPHFCDIDPVTHTLDPEQVKSLICKDTTSIMAVHQVNSPCHIRELESLADAYDVPLFFDSVHGIYCTYQGVPIGGFGEAEVFSLHATKILNGFEGGYITTNNKKLAEKIRQKRDHGIGQNGRIHELGLNAKLNEIHAACALSCLEDLPHLVERNYQRLNAYHENFQELPGLSWIEYNNQNEQMNYEFALLVIDANWPISRDDTVKLMRAENAFAAPYYCPPVHLSSHCPEYIDPPELPVTENLSKCIIQMPVGELVSLDDIALLGDFFRFLYAHADEINDRLSKGDY